MKVDPNDYLKSSERVETEPVQMVDMAEETPVAEVPLLEEPGFPKPDS